MEHCQRIRFVFFQNQESQRLSMPILAVPFGLHYGLHLVVSFIDKPLLKTTPYII